MALSSAQQTKIVQLLGYGGKALQAGSVIYDKIMNDRLHQLPPDTEHLLGVYLDQVAAIEAQMNVAPTRLAAKSVDNLQMNLQELEMLRKERKKIAREISALVDIPYVGVGGLNVSVSS